MSDCYKHNTSAALLTLGGGILGLYYFHLINNSFFVLAIVLMGPVDAGKSRALWIALLLSGILVHLSSSYSFQLSSFTSLIQGFQALSSCGYSFKALTHQAVIFFKLYHRQCWDLQLEPSVSLSGIENTGFINSLTNSKAKFYTSKTTLGIVFDDPKDPSAITDKILHHFNCGKSCAQSTTCIPHCTFITFINDDCLWKLAEMHSK